MEWTAAIARAVINPRHGVYEAQDGYFMERTHLPLKLHLPASVTIGGCMSKEAIEQKEVIVGAKGQRMQDYKAETYFA